MKSGSTAAALFAILASFTLVTATIDLKAVSHEPTDRVLHGTYLVELDPNAVGGNNGKRSANPHADFYEDLARRGVTEMDVRKEYDHELFLGASLTLKNGGDFGHLVNANGVLAVRPVALMSRPVLQDDLDGHVDPALMNGGGAAQTVHSMTGVDKLHQQGITGKDIRIAIIDTGVDYTHPNLGKCFGPNCKVAYGHDFVGDDYTGENTPVPDDDPKDCNGHGTHVAGIVGSNPQNQFNMTGVAYSATIGAYRIFGCEGSTGEDVIVDAILRAHTDGNDVITMSFGGPAGWTQSTISIVASRAAKTGRIVTIAAGNNGASGAFYASAPGSGTDVISVASVDNPVLPAQNAISSDRKAPIPYMGLVPLPFTESLPVYAISTDEAVPDDACNPLPDSTPDLSGFVVLIRYGTCTPLSKLENVAKKGARVALIYNSGYRPRILNGGVIPGAMISAEDGAYLLKQFNAGYPPTISFPQVGAASSIAVATGGLVSSFSTYGPTFDAYLKPALSAPGGGITSTFPVKMGSWNVLSGTSMSTPYMAGVSALLLAYKGRKPDVALAARDILQSTANKILSSKDDGALYQTASQQGAGLVNAFNALTYTTLVAPGQLLLNDTAYFNGTQTFTVTNSGKNPVTYTLTHTPAGTAHTIDNNSIQPNLYPLRLTADIASVSFSSSTFTLDPGQQKQVTATFTAPTFTDRTIPVYSGWIEVAGQETGEVLSVTYLGIAAKLKESKVIDNTDQVFGKQIPALVDLNNNLITDEKSYNFRDNNFPNVLFRLVFGTPALLFDLVGSDFDQSSLGQQDLQTRGRVADFLSNLPDTTNKISSLTGVQSEAGGSFSLVRTVGRLGEFDWVSRNNEEDTPGSGYDVFSLSTPKFADDTAIPNGRYRILMRALKVTGDPTNQDDYETWVSPVIGIES